ncbi:MAG: phosphoglycerate dehydrogenase [Anaerostipes sp.]|nr:phosphoglycerate dehydrogenase [Anaerostipes sp.]
MYKVKCLNPISEKGLDLFTSDFNVVEELQDADAVLVRSAGMHDLDVPESLLAVARAGAGVNNIPLDEYAKKGIVAFNTPGANANGVKELVVAGLLLASRGIIDGANWVRANKDDENLAKTVEKQKKQYAGNELKGKSIGVIGLGAIGVLVANICNRLGMNVYGYDPYVSVRSAWSLSRMVNHSSSLDEIYEKCDFITIHVPFMDATKGMIDADAVSKMKAGATILNFARGELVDQEAVLDGLDAGKLKHYVTDFPNAAVAQNDKVIAIPHLGASTEESEENCAEMAVDELMNYLENGNIVNSVNYPNCDLGNIESGARITVHHKNVPNMIGQLTAIIAGEGYNIVNMLNKSKGEWAYSILDIEKKLGKNIVEKMSEIDEVIRVRVL